MKILHLLSQNHLTGAEVYASTLAKAQQADGHQTFQVSNGFFIETSAEKYICEVETKSKIQFFKNANWLRNLIKSKQIQVIHTHSRAAAKLAYWARWGLPVGLVSTIHGQQHSSFSKKLFNQYGDMLIAVCENIRLHLIKDFNYNPRRISIIRNAIDEKLFSFHSATTNVHHVHKKIAIIGRTTGPKKTRTELLLRELEGLGHSVTLIGGKLENSSAVFQAIEHRDLNSASYADFDLVIGSGRVCMEALLSGVPTIAFGEAEYVGLIRPLNFFKALASNFGDINLKSSGPQLDSLAFKKDLETIMSEQEIKTLHKLAMVEFSTTRLHRKILRIYESAFFLRNFSRWIPILMYHKIPLEEIKSQHRIFVVKKNFKKHLQFFKRWGFQTLTFSELAAFRRGEKDFSLFPKKPLILTFDDGYQDNLDNASPLLKQYGFRAQLFLLANAGIANNQWDANNTEPAHEIVSGHARQMWLKSAFEIGSHGFSHKKMTDLSIDESMLELRTSKENLEKEFKVPINTFAFTYGITTEAAADMAQSAGYDYAVNTDSGGLLIEEAPYQIFRVNIFPEDNAFSLWKKTSSWYRNYYFKKRNK